MKGMPTRLDTIVAIATPPGRGGIGIVRLSGCDARALVEPLLRLENPLLHARARFGRLLDITSEAPYMVLDEVIATFFAKPNSYTAEDVVEIAAHGSPVLLEYLVRQCVARGARLAEPGEFTERSFRSGRIDLTQAEAVQDLIDSTTLHQARVAASQMGGGLSKSIAPIKAALIELIASLEALVDFAEDDMPGIAYSVMEAELESIRQPLLRLEQSFAQGRMLRDGFSIAIVGRPNVGKSSLFNALLERDRAIVTASAGTTRDVVSERIALRGIPVDLMDTAGIRSSSRSTSISGPTDPNAREPDEAERIGISRSHAVIAEADLVLLVLDATLPPGEEDLMILQQHRGRPLLVVANKCDLLQPEGRGQTDPELGREGAEGRLSSMIAESEYFSPSSEQARRLVKTSAVTSEGMADLREAILNEVRALLGTEHDSAMLTNIRQHRAVSMALTSLESALQAVQVTSPEEIILIDLHRALDCLDLLTGTTANDDVLERIFSTFCIGK